MNSNIDLHPEVNQFCWLYSTSWADVVCDTSPVESHLKNQTCSIKPLNDMSEYASMKDFFGFETNFPDYERWIRNPETNVPELKISYRFLTTNNLPFPVVLMEFKDGFTAAIVESWNDPLTWAHFLEVPRGVFDRAINYVPPFNEYNNRNVLKTVWEAAHGFRKAVTVDTGESVTSHYGTITGYEFGNHVLQGFTSVQSANTSRLTKKVDVFGILEIVEAGFDINNPDHYEWIDWGTQASNRLMCKSWEDTYRLYHQGWEIATLKLLYSNIFGMDFSRNYVAQTGLSTEEIRELFTNTLTEYLKNVDVNEASLLIRANISPQESASTVQGNGFDWEKVRALADLRKGYTANYLL